MVRKSTSAARRSSITCSTSALLLAQPDHHARFGEHRRVELLDPVEQAQRREIARARPHLGVKPRHGFEIVVEDIGPRPRPRSRSRRPCAGNRASAPRSWWRARRARIAAMVRAKCPAPPSSRSSRSTEVTTMCSRPSAATASPTRSRLVRVEPVGPAGRDVAEGAGAGADRAQDHHRRVLLLPALADIGAGRLLAHGVELELAHQLARLVIFRRVRRLDADPGAACAGSDCRACAPFRGGGAHVGGRSVIGLEVDGAAIGVKHGSRASSRRASDAGRWSRISSCFGGLQRLGDGIALDQLGHLGADHVRAQQFAGLGVEHGLDHALGLAQRDRLAVADEGEMADLDLVARRLGLPSRSGRRWPPAACNRCSRACCWTSSGCTSLSPAMCSTQITPSCIALCASQGGPTTSPIA